MRSLSLLSNLLRFLSRAEIPDFLLLPLLPFALPLLPFRFGRDCFREGDGPSLPELSEQSRTQIVVISITSLEAQCHGSQPVTSPTTGINPKPHSITPQLDNTFLFTPRNFAYLQHSKRVFYHRNSIYSPCIPNCNYTLKNHLRARHFFNP
jgi:hypothetical protein